MKYSGVVPAQKVIFGGLAVKLDPYIFQQLAEREDLPVIHGLKGIFNINHIYITVHDGMTFYTKVKEPMLGMRVSVEADKIESYIRL
jgi:hypothetical protein